MFLLNTGCTTGYWADRGHDAADVFTVTAGLGVGVAGRVGPISLGLMKCEDMAGLRCGVFGEFYDQSETNWVILMVGDTFSAPFAVDRGKQFAAITCLALTPKGSSTASKASSSRSSCSGGSFNVGSHGEEVLMVLAAVVATIVAVVIITGSVCLPIERSSLNQKNKRFACHSPYFTQVEVAAGFGGVARVGFNPGELMDLCLGFVGVDIYDDDLERRKQLESE
jgi:hypothetical protein